MVDNNMLDEELVDSFRVEAQEHLEAIESELFALEKVEDLGNDESRVLESLNSAFRAAHSLKGAAVFLGFNNVTAVTHAMENILGNLRDSEQSPGVECANILFDSLDVLRKLFDTLEKSDNLDVSAMITRLDNYVNSVETQETPETPAEIKTITNIVPDNQKKNAGASGMHCYRVVSSDKRVAKEIKLLGDVITANRLEGDSFEVIINTALEQDLFRMALSHTEFSLELYDVESEDFLAVDAMEVCCEVEPVEGKFAVENRGVDRLGNEKQVERLRQKVEPMVMPKNRDIKKIEENAVKALETSVRVPVSLLGELMSLAGELVLIRNQHLRWASEFGDAKAKDISSRLDTITTELQTSIIRTRMQPLDKVLSRLPRIVRDISLALDKKIKLDITGREVEVDKTILETIVDPLTHILRNCCDHGIELPTDRIIAGKYDTGHIRVAAQQESGHILISVSDDGKGIDPERIAESALKKGMITELELSKMSKQDKVNLIVLPGFSTAEAISNISGRGVGMDVVKSSIEKIGGSFEIISELGKGTTFKLTLPLTLAIIQSLVISDGGYKYLIPRVNLEEVISIVGRNIQSRIKAVNGQEVLNYHNSLLQLVRLNKVFETSVPFDSKKREEVSIEYQNYYHECAKNSDLVDSMVLDIAVVRVGQKRFGLIIDRALETEEIVVKPMHPAQSNIKIFLGSTIMGDGSVSLILDVEGIAQHALQDIRYVEKEHEVDQTIIHTESMQKVLTFSAASNERFALALSFIRRIYTIQSADIKELGGNEFVIIGDKSINLARLSKVFGYNALDREGELYLIMPRFGSYNCGIIATEIFGISDVNIDFDSSFIKKDGILGTTMVGENLIIFPDIYYVCETAMGADTQELTFRHGKSLDQPKRILIAEDTPFFRQLVKNYLSTESMIVDMAVNGKEALEMLCSNNYDLLLSDIEMPVMDGIELIQEVRSNERLKNIPAISLTSLNTDEDRERCLGAGYDKYLAKLNREEFHESIKSIFQMN